MRIENEIAVPASVEDTWRLLLDVPRVAPCMPGTEIVSARGPSEWTALMRMRVGPMNLVFDVQLTQRDVDQAARSVVLAVSAGEQKGRGTADAAVNWVLASRGDQTLMRVVTDLTLAGRLAQFARGVVEQLATDMTRGFAAALAEQLGAPGMSPSAQTAKGAAPSSADASQTAPHAASAMTTADSPEPARMDRMLLSAIFRSWAEALRRLLRRGRGSAA